MQNKRERAVEISRNLIESEEFKKRHRRSKKDFSRDSVLKFAIVLVLVLRNSVKSLQLVVNEAMNSLGIPTVTGSAYSQARYKLIHSAYMELNEKAIIETMYRDGDFKKFWGFRILAEDGSKIRLPDYDTIRDEFGTIAYNNGANATAEGEHPYAIASVLYDVLNRVCLAADLAPAKAYEVTLAMKHLAHTSDNDLTLYDRNYPSYLMLAGLHQQRTNYAARCSAASFTVARKMLKGEGPDSQVVTLTPCAKQKPLIREAGLPLSITVRFVRVKLDTGEYEVLVTSLLDETQYPTKEFKALYHLRWGVETLYGTMKTRLELENFTGQGPEAIRQDFFSIVYLTGLEAILTEEAQNQLNERKTENRQVVNRAVSFNAIKDLAFKLLFTQCPDNDLLILDQLTDSFTKNPCPKLDGYNPPRKKSSDKTLLNFQKRIRKHCY